MSDIVWRRKTIDARRQFLSDKVAIASKERPDVSVVRIILALLVELPDERDQYFNLDRFILALRSLMEHSRTGELREQEVSKLTDLCLTLLLHAGIKPGSSRLNYLYETLYWTNSQIDYRKTRHWDSAWNQTISNYFTDPKEGIEAARLALGNAIRSFRLGFGDSALDRLDAVIATAPEESRERAHAIVLKMRLLRMQGKDEEFSQAIADLGEQCRGHEALNLELEWEREVFNALRDRSIERLAKIVAKGQKFYGASYILEANLIFRIYGEKRVYQKLEKWQTVENRRDLSLKSAGVLYDAVLAMERCYDSEVATSARVVALGSVVGRKSTASSVYEELLILAAAIVWLKRVRLTDFRNLCCDEYRAISLRLTSGRSADCMKILSGESANEGEDAEDLRPNSQVETETED